MWKLVAKSFENILNRNVLNYHCSVRVLFQIIIVIMPSCCVVSCNNTRNLHIFPRNENLQKQWIAACGNPSNWIPRPEERICSDHFSPSDITSTRRVKEGALPHRKGIFYNTIFCEIMTLKLCLIFIVIHV